MGLYIIYAIGGVIAAFIGATIIGAVMGFFRLGRWAKPPC